MSAPAFTKGELEMLVSSTPTANGQFHLYLADATGRKVAALWGANDEKMANGYLWSAAPELYEAVRLFVEEYDAADAAEGVAMMLAYNRALEAGKAALAKARGDA